MITLNSKIPCLSEATEVINEISVKLPSQLLITKSTTSFDNNLYPLSMNNIFEAENFEPEPAFENTINEIKDDHMKSIVSATTNLSAIISFDNNFDPLSMNNSFEAEKIEPEPTFEKIIIEIKANYLKIITSIDMNLSAITSNKSALSYEHLRSYLMPWIILQSPEK